MKTVQVMVGWKEARNRPKDFPSYNIIPPRALYILYLNYITVVLENGSTILVILNY